MRIDVTQHQINVGDPTEGAENALALAIGAVLLPRYEAHVAMGELAVYDREAKRWIDLDDLTLPDEAIEFDEKCSWDTESVKPFSFELEIPPALLRQE